MSFAQTDNVPSHTVESIENIMYYLLSDKISEYDIEQIRNMRE